MKLPRDVSGQQLAILLRKYGYQITRQKGSHMRLTTQAEGEHHITIPCHDSLRVGTLSGIIESVAAHFHLDRSMLVEELFGR